jgi:probable O-glycosylation ligase (exosortase A-associated)
VVAGNRLTAAAAPRDPDLTWPFLIVLAYLLVDFGRPQDWFVPVGSIRPGVFALGGGMLTLFFRRELLHFPIRAWIMLALLGMMVIGTPFATNRYWAFITTADFMLFMFGAVVPLISFVDRDSRLHRLVTFFILMHVVLALYGITHEGIGIGSFLGDENDFALALNVVIPYVFFSLYFTRSQHQRLMMFAVLGVLLIGVTTSSSRGGFVGLLAVATYCWFVSPRKFVSLLVLAIIALPVLVMVPRGYWAEMRTIQTSTQNRDTGAMRLYQWNIGWEMFKDYPLLGVGPSNYNYTSDQYESQNQKDLGYHVWGRVSHSLYFTVLPEFGIVGLTLFVAFVTLGFRDNQKVRRAYRMLAAAGAGPPSRLQRLYELSMLTRANDAALVAYLVTGSFLAVFYYPHLWLHAGIGMAIRRSADAVMAEEGAAVEDPAPRRTLGQSGRVALPGLARRRGAAAARP